MRRKKEANKVKQTTRQSNTAHPRQSLFLRKMSCLECTCTCSCIGCRMKHLQTRLSFSFGSLSLCTSLSPHTDTDGDDYSAVDYPSTAAPIHIARAEHPPPLPTSLPPTSRPPPLPTSPPPTSRPAAYQATQLKAPQPPNTSPKPKRRTPQTTPPTPRAQPVPAVEAAKKEKSEHTCSSLVPRSSRGVRGRPGELIHNNCCFVL